MCLAIQMNVFIQRQFQTYLHTHIIHTGLLLHFKAVRTVHELVYQFE